MATQPSTVWVPLTMRGVALVGEMFAPAGAPAGDGEDPGVWQERALCAQSDPEIFFPEKGGTVRPAKRTCARCEVRAECLDYALAFDERFGIWGGLSERERRRIARTDRVAGAA